MHNVGMGAMVRVGQLVLETLIVAESWLPATMWVIISQLGRCIVRSKNDL